MDKILVPVQLSDLSETPRWVLRKVPCEDSVAWFPEKLSICALSPGGRGLLRIPHTRYGFMGCPWEAWKGIEAGAWEGKPREGIWMHLKHIVEYYIYVPTVPLTEEMYF